jgi:pimeloyl-ACP methyl ester carboxylesterase
MEQPGTGEESHHLAVASHGRERSIAIRLQPGAEPAILWLGGFRSDMRSTKAQALADWGKIHGRRIVRFDYMGHGDSSGAFEDGTISLWTEDALAVIRAFGGTAPVLVGSSMGGWISLIAARRLKAAHDPSFPSRMVLIAPAVDFTEELMWAKMSDPVQRQIMETGRWSRENPYGPPYQITHSLIEDGRKNLLFGKPFEVGCPVHILQGLKDVDVPAEQAEKLMQHLPLDTVTLTAIKDGDHRLSRDEDIAALLRALEG